MSVTCIAPDGARFSNSWWEWRPLARYCFAVCPTILERSNHYRRWQTNDGSATAAEAYALGTRLEQEVLSGRCLEYLQARRRQIEAMPDEPCDLCNATGTRHHTPLTASMCATFGGEPVEVGQSFECNACGGLGSKRPNEDLYFFTVENVAAFAAFCRRSGGFEVT